jgi:hypothetical protein
MLYTVRYIPASGGFQTAHDVKEADLAWFEANTWVVWIRPQ